MKRSNSFFFLFLTKHKHTHTHTPNKKSCYLITNHLPNITLDGRKICKRASENNFLKQ